MTREVMRGLRAKREELCRQEEEARRRAHVTNVVREVYQRATMLASVTDRTHYVYPVGGGDTVLAQDVVEGLRPLFPGCLVRCVEGDNVMDALGVMVDWSA